MSFHLPKKQSGIFRDMVSALLVTLLIFSSVVYAVQVHAEAVTLTATVASSLTFTTSTNQFGTITPGTYKIATTTLDVATNNVSGWNITLVGDSQSPSDTVMDLTTDAAIGLTDQTEWVPGVATTSAGNAVVRASLDSSGDVLAFRVMTASSTNGTAFLAPSWWGTNDTDGTAKFAGIASTTVQRQIGNAGVGSYSSSNHINTVQYYLDVPSTQQTGSYDGALTYTATAN
ncbi:MAG: hypothetical protein AB197_00625 [Parcubacteria bacterium C7867-002]|nr:MAG: hypothetical protein AB197_00625 [Parcubacteria bacterium C7867-002]